MIAVELCTRVQAAMLLCRAVMLGNDVSFSLPSFKSQEQKKKEQAAAEAAKRQQEKKEEQNLGRTTAVQMFKLSTAS